MYVFFNVGCIIERSRHKQEPTNANEFIRIPNWNSKSRISSTFTRAGGNWTLFWDSVIQSTSLTPYFFKFYCDIHISFHLLGSLPSKLLHPGFPLKFLIHFRSLTYELWPGRWTFLVFVTRLTFLQMLCKLRDVKNVSSWVINTE